LEHKKYFGTDGIRGRVGEGNINSQFMLKLGWAAGQSLPAGNGFRNQILIGKDTRVSGYMFESALETGIVAAGVDVILLGPMPTPAVAYLTRALRARLGMVISASHNAYHDNGVKLFNSQGLKLSDKDELAIEAWLGRDFGTVDSSKLGKVARLQDATGRYIEFCKSVLPRSSNLKGLKIVLDCAHGATYHIAPDVFQELGAQVVAIGVSPDGFNINDQNGATSLEALQARVLKEQADLGIAFDGDGDRVLFVDHRGEVVDGDELLYLIAIHKSRHTGQCSGVVGTLMSNLGLEAGLREQGIPFARSDVGDRNVMTLMHRRGWQLGGEPCGHLICGELTTTGDGPVAAMQVLRTLLDTGACLHDLKQGMTKIPQVVRNVHAACASALSTTPVLEAVRDAEHELGPRGRVLLRPSGTEPVVRVMVEGEDRQLVNSLADQLASLLDQEQDQEQGRASAGCP